MTMTGKTVLITGGTAVSAERRRSAWRRLVPGWVSPAAIGPGPRPIYLASSAEAEGISGRYFANRKAKESHKSAYDRETTGRLWQVSADPVGLPADPPH
jgi:hypothetical protein